MPCRIVDHREGIDRRVRRVVGGVRCFSTVEESSGRLSSGVFLEGLGRKSSGRACISVWYGWRRCLLVLVICPRPICIFILKANTDCRNSFPAATDCRNSIPAATATDLHAPHQNKYSRASSSFQALSLCLSPIQATRFDVERALAVALPADPMSGMTESASPQSTQRRRETIPSESVDSRRPVCSLDDVLAGRGL